jgi:hypothetical protein
MSVTSASWPPRQRLDHIRAQHDGLTYEEPTFLIDDDIEDRMGQNDDGEGEGEESGKP